MLKRYILQTRRKITKIPLPLTHNKGRKNEKEKKEIYKERKGAKKNEPRSFFLPSSPHI
jgi:hypothetical protein